MSVVKYIFRFENEKKVFEYVLNFDDDYLYIGKQGVESPEWTKLDSNKCANCPLKSEDCEYCPIAVNLASFIDDVKEMISYKKVTMVITDGQRSYVKKTDLQSGLFGMFGLVMASSDCPHMHFLRPMARYHLPFASVEETIYRVCSMYVLGQYVKRKSDPSVNISLDDLSGLYKNLEQVNEGMLSRVRMQEKGDAGKNALVALNLFAQMFEMEFFNDMSMVDKIFKY